MSGKKKKDDKEDLDFDFGDISDIKPVEEPKVEKVEEKPVVSEDDYSEVLERLKRACGAQWFCTPYTIEDKLYLKVVNLYDSTGEEFLEWLYWAYPLARTGGYKAQDFDDHNFREKTYKSILASCEYFKFSSTTTKNTYGF